MLVGLRVRQMTIRSGSALTFSAFPLAQVVNISDDLACVATRAGHFVDNCSPRGNLSQEVL